MLTLDNTEAIKRIKDHIRVHKIGEYPHIYLKEALGMAIAALEEVHGKWIKQWCDNNMIGHEYAECSVCGCSMLDTNQFWDCNFCPNCGVPMEGKNVMRGKDD